MSDEERCRTLGDDTLIAILHNLSASCVTESCACHLEDELVMVASKVEQKWLGTVSAAIHSLLFPGQSPCQQFPHEHIYLEASSDGKCGGPGT